ncbi:MAG: nucleotidyltransferase family protein [Burkholderiales bacterium]
MLHFASATAFGIWRCSAPPRGDDFDPASGDADFLVEFEPQSDLPALEEFFGFQADLSRLLERSVDLVEERAVRNPYVLVNINRTREVVYAA